VNVKTALKGIALGVFSIAAWPLAVLSGFGRVRVLYTFGAQVVAQAPGLPGDYLRSAYYWWTLRSCSLHSRISFGTLFSHPDAVVENHVYIGPYCLLGRVRIGTGTQIAGHVQVPSGARQHRRDNQGNVGGSEAGVFEPVRIGEHCWIGASAVVLADVGERTIIGAGAVVTKPVPAGVTAAGNPARVLGEG
jgi:virginiamycin A acetyltransferase